MSDTDGRRNPTSIYFHLSIYLLTICSFTHLFTYIPPERNVEDSRLEHHVALRMTLPIRGGQLPSHNFWSPATPTRRPAPRTAGEGELEKPRDGVTSEGELPPWSRWTSPQWSRSSSGWRQPSGVPRPLSLPDGPARANQRAFSPPPTGLRRVSTEATKNVHLLHAKQLKATGRFPRRRVIF